MRLELQVLDDLRLQVVGRVGAHVAADAGDDLNRSAQPADQLALLEDHDVEPRTC